MNDTLSLRKRLGLEIARKLTDLTIAEHLLRHLFWQYTLRRNLHCRHYGSDCKKQSGYLDDVDRWYNGKYEFTAREALKKEAR